MHGFRTQGAFLLSAVREGGATRWVRLTSEAGAPCVVHHGIAGPVEVRDEQGRPLRIAPVRPNEEAPAWGLPRTE